MLNQLYIPALVSRTLLLLSRFFICFSVNSRLILYARMLESPLIVERNPETIGELVDF